MTGATLVDVDRFTAAMVKAKDEFYVRIIREAYGCFYVPSPEFGTDQI